jgi:hypothetical protein
MNILLPLLHNNSALKLQQMGSQAAMAVELSGQILPSMWGERNHRCVILSKVHMLHQ